MNASASLPDDAELLKSLLLAERAESERLRQIIKELQRHRFGPRAESLPVDQLLLGLEEVEQVEAAGEADDEAVRPSARAGPPGSGRAEAPSRPTCRGSSGSSTSRAGPARAVRARCIGSART